MSEQKTVMIKGVLYDIETGKPVRRADAPQKHVIQKFAPQPVRTAHAAPRDIAPAPHPAVAKAHAAHAAKKQVHAPKPSAVIKNEAIAEAMSRTGGHSRKPVKLKKNRSKLQRFTRTATAALALLILGGYLTYINMPAISTRVAAAQAGINATFPSYQPSGYRLSGPVAYSNGMVTIKFAANAGPQTYTITQERSSWDSTAVLANYIHPKVGTSYVTTRTNGLTIYSYGQSAAWVNGGILYTISGDAPLSNEQLQHIAVSM